MEYIQRSIDVNPSDEYISYSRLDTYTGCPQKYYYNYVLKAPKEGVPAALIFGSAAHDIIQQVYEALKASSPVPTDRELSDIASTSFDKNLEATYNETRAIDFPNKPGQRNLGELKDKLINTLIAWKDHTEMPDEVCATESKFRAIILNPETGEQHPKHLYGLVDAITQRNGTTVLEEHKTAGQKWTQEKANSNEQVTLYLATYPELTRARFNILIKTKIPSFQSFSTTRSQATKKSLAQDIFGKLDGIEKGVHYRIKSWRCPTCQFRRRCQPHVYG